MAHDGCVSLGHWHSHHHVDWRFAYLSGRLLQTPEVHVKRLLARQTTPWARMCRMLLNNAWPEHYKIDFPDLIREHKMTMLKRWRSICSQWVRHELTYGQQPLPSERVSCILPVYINSIKPDVDDSDTDDADCLPDVDVDGWIRGMD